MYFAYLSLTCMYVKKIVVVYKIVVETECLEMCFEIPSKHTPIR